MCRGFRPAFLTEILEKLVYIKANTLLACLALRSPGPWHSALRVLPRKAECQGVNPSNSLVH